MVKNIYYCYVEETDMSWWRENMVSADKDQENPGKTKPTQ